MRRLFVVVCLSLVFPWSAAADDTGSLRGRTFDGAGASLGGVRISATSRSVGGSRETISDSQGWFSLEFLPPGAYDVDYSHAVEGRVAHRMAIHAGQETYTEVIVGAGLAETVTVSGVGAGLDMRPHGQGTSVDASTVDALPLERSFRGLLQLMPGLPENRSNVGFAFGASRQENAYVVDGVTITNPAFGYQGTEVNPVDVADVNFRQGGISAEFGRSGGFVVTVATPRGSNRVTGLGRLDWLPVRGIAAPRLDPALRAMGVSSRAFIDPLLMGQTQFAAAVGGPLVRDRVFGYASAQAVRAERWDAENRLGEPLPRELRREREAFGKLTLAWARAGQFVTSVRVRPLHVDHAALSAAASADTGVRSRNGSQQISSTWNGAIGSRGTFSLQLSDVLETRRDTPERALGYLPAFDVSRLADMGQYADPTRGNLTVGARAYTARQDYRRTTVRGRFAQEVALGASRHHVRAGASWESGQETFERTANGWGTIVNLTVSGVPQLRARYYAPQSPQVGRGITGAVFVQDDVDVGRASATLGVLANSDTFSQVVDGSGGCPSGIAGRGVAVYESSGDRCTFLRFGLRTQVQPRLGLSLRLRAQGADKVYATWGRYSSMEQKSSVRSLAPRAIVQTQALFDLTGRQTSQAPLASTTGKLIDPALQPTYTDEWSAGYSALLRSRYMLDVSGLRRRTHRFIEDVPSRASVSVPDAGPYVAANLPCVTYTACQAADGVRRYQAATVSVRRLPTARWSADLSYTWSAFTGNVDYDYSTVGIFNTSSFIQDGPGTNVEESNRMGRLLEDRPHVFKASARVQLWSSATVGVLARTQSGTPWTARARDWEGSILNYLEPAGSHRNPTWTNVDLLAGYDVHRVGRLRTHVEVRVFNLFDRQTRLTTDSQQYLDLRTTSTPPYFAPYLQPNRFFGTGNLFAPPRRVQASVDLRF